jgi:Domain of unknown function (DUF4198)
MRKTTLVLAAALACAASAQAHDTWFSHQTDGLLTLATGNRFPVGEQGVDTKFFTRQGCRGPQGVAAPLALVRYTETASLLRSPPAGTTTCWVQLEPFEFELPPDKIEVYFKEIRPSAAVLQAWAQLRARGLPFIERYTKSARIDLGPEASAVTVGTAMDVLRETAAPKVGNEAVFQLLRAGKPLADFNVELVNERSPIGLWHRTDAQGRIRARLPLPGRWLLRGTDLRLSERDATKWESQFITYAFDVAR